MARMYPSMPRQDTRSIAEIRLFEVLRESLPERIRVLHGMPLSFKSSSGGREEGEIDFLIFDPERGLLIIEVKGGDIDFNAETGRWMSLDGGDVLHEIKNPFAQAERLQHLLYTILTTRDDLKQAAFWEVGRAVWFPDIEIRSRALLGATGMAELTLDRADMQTASTSLQKIWDSFGFPTRGGPGSAGVRAIERAFLQSFHLRRRLSTQLRELQDQELIATERQYEVLEYLSHQKRALIAGVAGSGKTLIAMEKARRSLEEYPEGRVLLLCFNENLARHLRDATAGMERLEVFTFHGLCRDLCKRNTLPIPPLTSTDPEEREKIYNERMPAALERCIYETDERYDAIIVDEGQDFRRNWWDRIELLLRNERRSSLYVFYDANQAIYNDVLQFPVDTPPFPLLGNCRNTRQVHAELMQYYQGQDSPRSLGPDGPAVRHVPIEEGDAWKAVRGELVRLIQEEGVAPQEIVVLSPVRGESCLKEDAQVAGCRLSWKADDPLPPRTIQCSSIHAFKGLERPVVVISEAHRCHPGTRRQLMYVAISRATGHVSIVREQFD